MDWNRIEGNWKQFKGRAKEKWGVSLMTISTLSVGGESSLRGRFRSDMGLRRTRPNRMWTPGQIH
jgi:hypothetical protein